jgi:hypothetical protein
MRIGVISDTHGLLRPEALTALAGTDAILHAGDVGDAGILEALRQIAPVTAIWAGRRFTCCTTSSSWISIPARRGSMLW